MFFDSSIVLQILDLGDSNPISLIFFLNSCLFSAFRIAVEFAPMSSTLYLFKIPSCSNLIAALRPVCPPIVGNIAFGFSIFIISSNISDVIGSI